MFSDSSVSFYNITNCEGNVTNMRSVFHSRRIHTRMTQERAGQSLQIEHGVYVTVGINMYSLGRVSANNKIQVETRNTTD